MLKETPVKSPKVFQVLKGASSSYCPLISCAWALVGRKIKRQITRKRKKFSHFFMNNSGKYLQIKIILNRLYYLKVQLE